MIQVRDAVQSDLDYVLEHPINEEVVKHFQGIKLSGWAKTAMWNSQILVVGGCVVYWAGVAEGWYALSEHAINKKIGMVRCINELVNAAFEELNLHRLQTSIRVDFVNAVKMIEFAGFKKEGLMKKYTEDEIDSYLYALTK